MAFKALVAVFCQEKERANFLPLSHSCSLGIVNIFSRHCAMSSGLEGSNKPASGPANSGMDEVLETATGVPEAKDSKIGSPKPS